MAATRVMLLFLLCKGCVCQIGSYRVNASRSVKVQAGLCVFIPCTFTYPPTQTLSKMAHGYWCRDLGAEQFRRVTPINDPNAQAVSQETAGRFHFMGDLSKNDCSLGISSAKMQDQGTYFFRIEDVFRYSYKMPMTEITVQKLTEKPVITLPGALVEGITALATCTFPKKCSGEPPKNIQERMLNIQHSQSNTTITLEDGTQSHMSTMALKPSRTQHNTLLTCEVVFPLANVYSKQVVLLTIENSTEATNIPPLKGCTNVDSGLIAGMVVGNLLVLALIGMIAAYSVNKFKKKYQAGEVNNASTKAEPTYEDLGETTPTIYINLNTFPKK
ncbi:sialic acid-binding Ig-like lectin 13 [Ambystoma mexicanum]|uniref:sialic acid-binding Ig-like lectin 13 n=1 Tax=Ambystoma mexicanum TaxID=8296 RepID=UPI0037E8202D